MAISVVVLALAVGCASTRTPAVSTLSAVSPSGPASAQSSPARTVEQNKEAADDEARRLLALAPKPPGAKSVAVVPGGLSGPAMGAPMTGSLVDKTEFWRVPMSLDDSIAWLRAHQPGGMEYLGESSGSGDGQSLRGLAWAPANDAEIASGVGGPELQVDVAAVDTHNSSWRVDAIDTWLDPVPYRDDAKGPRMRVTVAAGCLSTDKGEVGVSNDGADLDSALLPTAVPAAGLVCDYSGMNGNAFALIKSVTLSASDAARLAAAVRASQLSHLDDAMTSCPMDDGSLAVLAFSYPGRADVDVAYHYTGCPSVANGHISGAPSEQLAALTHPSAAAPSSAP